MRADLFFEFGNRIILAAESGDKNTPGIRVPYEIGENPARQRRIS